MSDAQARTIGMALFGGASVFIGVTAALWLLMALIAYFRIFLKNRRFTMWYVKLTAWLPGTLFVLAPAIGIKFAPALIASMGGEAAGGAAGMTGMLESIGLAFGGSGVVSLICLGVLWLVSIFWCFPIKRKIRKLNKEIKYGR